MGRPTTTAADYDAGIGKTIPFYDELHRQVLDVVRHSGATPGAWLDSGCGTGTFALAASAAFPEACFHLIDPFDDMLAVARARLADRGAVREIKRAGAEDAGYPDATFQAVTAVLSHHYFSPEQRRRATADIARMLAPGGVYVTVEHVAAHGPRGDAIARSRWRAFQIASGKSADQADAHLARAGREFFPIPAEAHLALLRGCGFATAELFWYAYGQIGVYGIR